MIRQVAPKRKPASQTQPVASVEERLANLQAAIEVLKAQVHQSQQLASLGTAAAMFAHEVNNLLTPILAYADSALQGTDDQFCRKALTVAARNVRILIGMSSRTLELGAAKPHKPEKTDLREAVVEALASMCRDLEKDGITFAMKIEEGTHVLADPLQLRQIFFNLFLNAREAMAPTHSGRLVVTATKLPISDCRSAIHGERVDQIANRQSQIDNLVSIEVRNTGPAIPPEVLPNIFEPFQTTKPAQRNGKVRCGGLGLALVRDLVHENGGTITAASDDQTGTTFTIALPPAC